MYFKNHIPLFFAALFCSLLAYGQQNCNIDTIKIYLRPPGALHFTIRGDTTNGKVPDTTCTLNGEPFPIDLYLKITNHDCYLWGTCLNDKGSDRVFYVTAYNLDEKLIYSTYQISAEPIYFGSYYEYYESGNLKTQGQYLFFCNDFDKYFIRKNWNKRVGVWKFYNENGHLKRKRNYRNILRKLSGQLITAAKKQ